MPVNRDRMVRRYDAIVDKLELAQIELDSLSSDLESEVQTLDEKLYADRIDKLLEARRVLGGAYGDVDEVLRHLDAHEDLIKQLLRS